MQFTCEVTLNNSKGENWRAPVGVGREICMREREGRVRLHWVVAGL